MEIYVRVHDTDDGMTAWYTDENGESYLTDGKDLWCLDSPYGDYKRGTAFKTAAAAKRAAKNALDLARYDGAIHPKATFWHYNRGKLVEVKFTKDGRLKR